MKRVFYIFLVLFTCSTVFAQTTTNLGIIYKLIDTSVIKIDSSLILKDEKPGIVLSIPQPLEQLKPKIIQSFQNKGYEVNPENSKYSLNYVLIDASVNYGDSFTDGLFGDVLTSRKINLNGSYFLSGINGTSDPVTFKLFNIDTVKVDNINEIESSSLPFSQGKIPQPPILSNLMEPIIVVGTLITTIILLFTIRSK